MHVKSLRVGFHQLQHARQHSREHHFGGREDLVRGFSLAACRQHSRWMVHSSVWLRDACTHADAVQTPACTRLWRTHSNSLCCEATTVDSSLAWPIETRTPSMIGSVRDPRSMRNCHLYDA